MNFLRRRKLPLILLAALIAAILLIWFHRHKNYAANTTSKAPTAQNNYSSGSARPNSGNNITQGTAVDKQGASVPQPSGGTANAATSDSGLITLSQPTSGATLKSGDGIAGSAQVSTIHYRLVDSDIGQIASGTLKVVNGRFSGILNFNSAGASGKLDVFSLDASGNEVNTVTTPIKFSG